VRGLQGVEEREELADLHLSVLKHDGGLAARGAAVIVDRQDEVCPLVYRFYGEAPEVAPKDEPDEFLADLVGDLSPRSEQLQRVV
jgi:hypothetical protein